jgi:hypothetical protein
MSVIERIRIAMGDNEEVVKFAFWNKEITVYLWDKEVPISAFPNEGMEGRVILDTEGYNWQLDVGQVKIISDVMEILLENMDELRSYIQPV